MIEITMDEYRVIMIDLLTYDGYRENDMEIY